MVAFFPGDIYNSRAFSAYPSPPSVSKRNVDNAVSEMSDGIS